MKCVLDWESKALTGIDGLCQNSQLFHFQTNINNENPATSARQINSCKTLKKTLGYLSNSRDPISTNTF